MFCLTTWFGFLHVFYMFVLVVWYDLLTFLILVRIWIIERDVWTFVEVIFEGHYWTSSFMISLQGHVKGYFWRSFWTTQLRFGTAWNASKIRFTMWDVHGFTVVFWSQHVFVQSSSFILMSGNQDYSLIITPVLYIYTSRSGLVRSALFWTCLVRFACFPNYLAVWGEQQPV